MSKQPNSLAIGSFLVGALLLLTLGIMVFGGSDFFKHKKRYVIFFDSALNGLNIGAPVKLQGVQIGNVEEISLEMDAATGKIFKPVVIEIEPGLVRDFSGRKSVPHAGQQIDDDVQYLMDLGLKARLETQSLLTGLLYVDLDFFPDKPINLVDIDYKSLPELPSVPTTADVIRNIVDDVFQKIQKLPLEQMVVDLSDTIHDAHDLLQSDDFKKGFLALSKTLQESQKLLITLNAQVGPLMVNGNLAVTDSRNNLKAILPILQSAEQSLNTANQVLQQSQHTLSTVEEFANPDALLGQSLKEIRDASRAMKDLSESIDRQPNVLLYGK